MENKTFIIFAKKRIMLVKQILYQWTKHKGIWSIWAVFLISIAMLLLFQSMWLYSALRMKRYELEEAINKKMQQSIDEEVELRHRRSEEAFIYNPKVPEDFDIGSAQELNNEEVIEAGVLQQLLQFIGSPFELADLDSIFRSKLVEDNIMLHYLLCYVDSTGAVIEHIGDTTLKERHTTFVSNLYLIVDGKRVYAEVDIPFLAVSGMMLWLLVGSFLMLMLIVACIIYQTGILFLRYRLNQLRDDFTNALTHDMKTPLSMIQGVVAQLTGDQFDDKPEIKEKFRELADRQIDALQKMIDQILTTGKYEQGRIMLNRSTINIDNMIKHLTARFEILQTKKKIVFRTNIALQNTTICLDESLIENAIANLIENAIKYSGDPVHIDIHCLMENKMLIISVKDDGFGISRKDSQIIFNKFERGAAAFRKGASGFGLGLTYVKSVVEAHGGVVTVKSMEGEGSEFILKMPVVANN